MRLSHALSALYAVTSREAGHFVNQTGRLLSAIVRPALWLFVFAVGFQNVLGGAATSPYRGPVDYQVYIVPGLLGMVLLFNGMQSSLSMVYDREMGMMRFLLTAPLSRWYLLLCKLVAGATLSILQAYSFLILVYLVGIDVPVMGWVTALPALIAGALMLGASGLLLSVTIKQLENFAGTMNFVIFPMFFLSSALYPLWKLQETRGAAVLWLTRLNPFTYAVELIRYALYGQFNLQAALVVCTCTIGFFWAAAYGYDPQRGTLRRSPQAG